MFCRLERKKNGRRKSNLGGNIISRGQILFPLYPVFVRQGSRNQSALVAFTLPQNWKQGAGLSIVATHVDSPNLRVRSKPSIISAVMMLFVDSSHFEANEIILPSCWCRDIWRRNMALLVRSRPWHRWKNCCHGKVWHLYF